MKNSKSNNEAKQGTPDQKAELLNQHKGDKSDAPERSKWCKPQDTRFQMTTSWELKQSPQLRKTGEA